MTTIEEVREKIAKYDEEISKLPVGSDERLRLINSREWLVAYLRVTIKKQGEKSPASC